MVSLFGYVFDEILKVAENPFQSLVVLSFLAFCVISLFTHSRHKLFYILAIPVFTQFIHIFQKYDFTTGANSFWRLFPFLILDLYFVNFFFKKRSELSRQNKFFICSWIIFNTFFLIISVNLERLIGGAIVLYIITLPFLFSYLNLAYQAENFCDQIEKYLCLVFIILGLGTFGLVYAGAGYKGSDNLLATRNIADTNVTMAYFILLWPFALLYSLRNSISQLFRFGILAIFLGVVVLSFSRGAVLIVLPYIFITILFVPNFLSPKWILALLVLIVSYTAKIAGFLEQQDLIYFWKLRFGDMVSVNSLLSKLESASGRGEIHRIAYSLFLKSPLIGHGIGSFEILGPGYREAHSMWYTLLAEEGIVGAVYHYWIFIVLGLVLLKTAVREKKHAVFLISLLFYLLFNHTVGSVFVILPGKSITINCIAPILLICLYFYSKSRESEIEIHENLHRSQA